MNSNHLNQFPKARTTELIIKELPDETLVYDLAQDKAHCLNRTSALVWKKCDGNNSIADIRVELSDQMGTPVNERVIWLALAQLKSFNLMTDNPTHPVIFDGLSRRQLIRALGVGAVALPMIVTMAVQPAHAQGSCIPPGQGAPCNPGAGGTNCCSGIGNCTAAPPKVCS